MGLSSAGGVLAKTPDSWAQLLDRRPVSSTQHFHLTEVGILHGSLSCLPLILQDLGRVPPWGELGLHPYEMHLKLDSVTYYMCSSGQVA